MFIAEGKLIDIVTCNCDYSILQFNDSLEVRVRVLVQEQERR